MQILIAHKSGERLAFSVSHRHADLRRCEILYTAACAVLLPYAARMDQGLGD